MEGRKKSDGNWPYIWAKIYGIGAPILIISGNTILATKKLFALPLEWKKEYLMAKAITQGIWVISSFVP